MKILLLIIFAAIITLKDVGTKYYLFDKDSKRVGYIEKRSDTRLEVFNKDSIRKGYWKRFPDSDWRFYKLEEGGK